MNLLEHIKDIIKHINYKKCHNCNGTGNVLYFRQKRGEDAYAICSECKGTGRINRGGD